MTATTTHRAPSYRPAPATTHNAMQRLEAAYRLAKVDPPTRSTEVLAAVNEHPTAASVARDLAAEAIAAPDPGPWIEDALPRIQRAQAADALRAALREHHAAAARAAHPRMVATATEAVADAFSATVAQLAKAAGKLPDGPDPLDLEAVVALDATREHKSALAALSDLATFAGVHDPYLSGDTAPRVAALLPVVDVPQVPQEIRTGLGEGTTNPDAERDNVRAMFRRAERYGADAALIALARGEFGKRLRINLARDGAELVKRTERARIAHTYRTAG
ncbi:hypothetical protein NF556_11560 [Ornithinimicrobium faecis]|uniref:DUF222 domain-containing protein n=1 Tax=Ornithinimicrobium faecis TaxID=2934158 RepID=A0ABY4YPV2_9MICO|nr:hypothetical protein [Ornithinimicrobium sp. HY1793]USQ78290.1 hypothetical protein NF556_11560 [Ornithinimicrobium sp. HY1793]